MTRLTAAILRLVFLLLGTGILLASDQQAAVAAWNIAFIFNIGLAMLTTAGEKEGKSQAGSDGAGEGGTRERA
jgi:hypothetical protein